MWLHKIRALLLDVDGVLTDGTFAIGGDGLESKMFHSQDGAGIKYARRAGLLVGLITGRDSKAVAHRARELGVDEVYLHSLNKIEAYEDILAKHQLTDEEVCYLGDDLVDIPIMRRVAFPVSVPDAMPDVKSIAKYVTRRPAGHGAVREVVELLLKVQGKWPQIMARYE